jgi:histidine triad (HIT) family protein
VAKSRPDRSDNPGGSTEPPRFHDPYADNFNIALVDRKERSPVSLSGTYDRNNIFAGVLRGEVDVARVFEDDDVLAFMDAFPQSKGHVLAIPKGSASRNLLDIDSEKLSVLIVAVQRLAKAVAKAFQPDGISVLQFNGAAGGQTVFHLHFHIIPRWHVEDLQPHAHGVRADMLELRRLATRIAQHLD